MHNLFVSEQPFSRAHTAPEMHLLEGLALAGTLEQITTKELRSLVDFSRLLVTKEQEKADAEETRALERAGAGFIETDRATRDWVQVTAYYAPGSVSPEMARDPSWVRRLPESAEATLAIDSKRGIWERTGYESWRNIASGLVISRPEADWPVLEVPRGESFVDPVKKRFLIASIIWFDRTTGEVSAQGPGAGSEFVDRGETATVVRPEGLSDLIPTSQEYVSALLTLQSGVLSGSDRVALQAAIESFEAPGMWEDRRQPLYATDSGGRLILGDDGLPLVNPLRLVSVPFRGELNDYYRRLVRDHNISPFASRTAEQFEIIRWSAVAGMSTEDSNRFVRSHSECVRVFKTAFYNEALEGDELYFNYCRLYIAWMTIMRMVNGRMEGIGDVNRMNDYEVSNLLYSFGVYQFDDMPIVYRRRFAKNLEKILSVKGTTQAFRDILSLFGLSRNVSIWKHYLVRYFPRSTVVCRFPRRAAAGETLEVVLSNEDVFSLSVGDGSHDATVAMMATALSNTPFFRKATVSADGLGITLWSEEGQNVAATECTIVNHEGDELAAGVITVGSTDYGLPEVGFQKTDVDDPVAESTIAAMDTSYLTDFDEFVSRDRTWEVTREEARDMPFSVLQTKYFSMSAALDTVQNGMSLAVLWGALKDAQARGRAGSLLIPSATTLPGVVSMTLFEAFVACLTMILWRFGVEDIIPHGESGVSTILQARTDNVAFPNEGSLLPYSTVLRRVADEIDPLEVEAVVDVAEGNIALSSRIHGSISQLGRESTSGSYHGVLGGEETRDQDRRVKLERLWNHKFISELQTQAFGADEKYSEWLDRVNPELSTWVKGQDSEGTLIDGIMSLTVLVEDAIDSDVFDLTTAFGTNDVIMTYVERMVRFFKAYTTDLRDFSTFVLIDRPATETIRLMNLLAAVDVNWTRSSNLVLQELVSMLITWSASENEDKDFLTDAHAIFAKISEQDIAEIFDAIELWRSLLRNVDPSPRFRDAAHIRTTFGRKDHLTVRTRRQRPEDIKVTEDAAGDLLLHSARLRTEAPGNISSAELTDRTETSSGLTTGVIRHEPFSDVPLPGQGLSDRAALFSWKDNT